MESAVIHVHVNTLTPAWFKSDFKQ